MENLPNDRPTTFFTSNSVRLQHDSKELNRPSPRRTPGPGPLSVDLPITGAPSAGAAVAGLPSVCTQGAGPTSPGPPKALPLSSGVAGVGLSNVGPLGVCPLGVCPLGVCPLGVDLPITSLLSASVFGIFRPRVFFLKPRPHSELVKFGAGPARFKQIQEGVSIFLYCCFCPLRYLLRTPPRPFPSK